MKSKDTILMFIGVYLILDGFFSILMFYPQDTINHIPRILRILIGLFLMIKAAEIWI